MKRIARAAFTTSLLCATAGASLFLGAVSAQAADKTEKVSPAIGKPLQDAATAAKANDWATAMADVKLAQAVPDPTPFDTYKINQFLAVVSINQKDYATAATATEAAADSPAMPDADKPPTYKNAFILASNTKQYDKAITYGQDLIALGPIDDATNVQLAIDYYELKDIAHAQHHLLAQLCKPDLTCTPFDQRDTQRVFEIFDLHGQRRLRHRAGFGGTAEMIAARQSIEISQLAKGNVLHKIILSQMAEKSIFPDGLSGIV